MGDAPFTEEDLQLAETGLRKWFHSDVDGYAHKGHAATAEECAHCYEAAEQAVSALAEAGRLLPPDPVSEREEFGVRWLGDDGGVPFLLERLPAFDVAVRLADEYLGDRGTTSYQLSRRVHRDFADGTQCVGPWVEVPQQDEETE